MNINRRQIIQSLLLLGAGGVLAKYWLTFPNNNSNNPSFTIFSELCAIVTLRNNLDNETMRRIYELFIAEPWGAQNIGKLYDKISQQSANKESAQIIDDGEKWFLSHLLTTLYLGIYYHENQPPQRVAHETALMYDAVKNILPIPFIEATSFGRWSNPPKEFHG